MTEVARDCHLAVCGFIYGAVRVLSQTRATARSAGLRSLRQGGGMVWETPVRCTAMAVALRVAARQR
eukprot:5616184-Pleurochrysis_carterae.AAC.1